MAQDFAEKKHAIHDLHNIKFFFADAINSFEQLIQYQLLSTITDYPFKLENIKNHTVVKYNNLVTLDWFHETNSVVISLVEDTVSQVGQNVKVIITKRTADEKELHVVTEGKNCLKLVMNGFPPEECLTFVNMMIEYVLMKVKGNDE